MRRILFALCLLVAAAASLQASPVEADHPVYGFLRRLEMSGLVSPGRLSTLPRPKEEVAALLDQADADARTRPREKSEISRFRKLLDLDPPDSPGRQSRSHPLIYEDSTTLVAAHIQYFSGGYYEDSLPKAMAYASGSLNATLEGAYRKKLQFISTGGVGMERSHYARFVENYDPARGMPYNTDRLGKTGRPRTVSTMDAFRTVVGYRDETVRLEMGSDWNQWGPGVWQHPLLSQRPWFWVQDSLPAEDSSGFAGTPYPGRYRRGYRYPGEGAPMTQVRMGFRMGWAEYTKIVAERQGLWTDSSAHVIAHRLEARPWPSLGIGLQEMICTAGRPVDWTYIIPFVPLKYTEHQLGDRDNAAVAADVEYLWAGHGRAYGELLLDDWSGWDPGFWGNKFAFSFGAEAVDLPFAGSLLQAEFSHVEPWVFTHNHADDQMQHFGALLGSSLPANSHALHLAWEQPVPAGIDVRLEYQFMQRDATSRGSSVFDRHNDAADGRTKTFLGGTVETRNGLTLSGIYRWERFLELKASAGFLAVDNWKSREGVSLTTPLASGEIRLRY